MTEHPGLRIGEDLAFPPDVVTETLLIIAKRGSGKTHCASVLVEEMVSAGLPVAVIDPIGVWWGLRSSADGQGPGLPVTILGGEHADLPLPPESGALVADLIVDERLPVVLDLSLLSKTQQRRFVTDFLERIYHRNRDPLHLVIDEADLYCMSADTEVLTPEGWARWDQIRVGKEVVAFDLDTGEYRNEPVQRLLLREHDGDMVRLKTKGIDQLVTPDHRVVLRRMQRAPGRYGKIYDWSFCSAAEVPTCVQVPLGGAPAGAGVDIDDQLLRILGWVITDGYNSAVPGRPPRYGIEQSYNTVKRGESIAAAMACVLDPIPGVVRWERPVRTSITMGRTITSGPSVGWRLGINLCAQIAKVLGDDMHRIPRRIMEEASPGQLRILMQALLEGDGSAPSGEWSHFYPGGNEGLADDFQELATRLGISSVKIWVPSVRQWHVTISERSHHHVRRPAREHYRGLVWDITVPSGAFVARRNGRVFVTGNCPMRGGTDTARLRGAYEDIVRRGRARGLGCTSITQRPAVLHTDIRSQAEVLIALRLIGTHDVAAIDEWVRLHATDEEAREVKASLPSLPVGTAWVWSPGWLELLAKVKIRQRLTFDSSATPKVGQRRVVPREFAPVNPADLERLAGRLRTVTPEPVPAKAGSDEVRRLAGEVAKLRGQLAEAQHREPERVEVPVLAPGDIAALEQAITGLRDVAGSLELALSRAARPVTPAPRPAASSPRPAASSPRPAERPRPAPESGSEPLALGKPHRAVLTVLVQFPEGRTKNQIATLSGYSVKSSTFSNTLSALRVAGLITRSTPIQATPEGCAALGDLAEPLPAGQALIDYWMGRLGKSERAVLQALLDAWPRPLDKDAISAATGYSVTSSTFSNALSRLRTLELISGYGEMRADETLAQQAASHAV